MFFTPSTVRFGSGTSRTSALRFLPSRLRGLTRKQTDKLPGRRTHLLLDTEKFERRDVIHLRIPQQRAAAHPFLKHPLNALTSLSPIPDGDLPDPLSIIDLAVRAERLYVRNAPSPVKTFFPRPPPPSERGGVFSRFIFSVFIFHHCSPVIERHQKRLSPEGWPAASRPKPTASKLQTG